MKKKALFVTLVFVLLLTMVFLYNSNFTQRTIERLSGRYPDANILKTVPLSELEATIYSTDQNGIAHVLIKKSFLKSKLIEETKQGDVLESLEKIGYTYSATHIASKNNEKLIYGKYNPDRITLRVFLEDKKNEQIVHVEEDKSIWWTVVTSPNAKKIIIISETEEGSFSEREIEL